MRLETNINPPNSLLLILDNENGVIPESMNGELVAATPSCVAIGTLSEADGSTNVILTDERSYLSEARSLQLVFSGFLDTPQMKVALSTVYLRSILVLNVVREQTFLELWVNDLVEPDMICVLIDNSVTTDG